MLKYLLGLVLIGAIAGGVFIFIGRDGGGNTDTGQQAQTATPPATDTTPTSSSQAQSAANEISISNFVFSPTDITVKKGATVTWTNNDSVAHSVVFDTDDIPKSQTLGTGQKYSFTFNDEGTFNYACGIHPQMHGTVTVTE